MGSNGKNESSRNSGAMAIGTGLGCALGAVVGLLTENIGLWLPIGVAIGTGLGVAIGSQKTESH